MKEIPGRDSVSLHRSSSSDQAGPDVGSVNEYEVEEAYVRDVREDEDLFGVQGRLGCTAYTFASLLSTFML